jgi:methylenetetrahydrofolate reductase (NADPH)
MKVIEKLNKAKGPLISFEIVPPPRGRTIHDLIQIVETLLPMNPAWIDVTAHASHADMHEQDDGTFQRKISRKRPGTIGICGIIQNRFKIDTVAHVLCLGFTKEETEDALIEMNYLGVENVLALRGDYPNFEKKVSKDRSVNHQASDLVQQIKDLRSGQYITELEGSHPMDFCIGVAGYPEKHQEAPNLHTDIQFLKQKIDAGGDYIVTQMFFDNKHFYNFKSECDKVGITAPIVPGLKVIRNLSQMNRIPKTFHVDLPESVSDEILKNPKHAQEIGIQHCIAQCKDLLANNVPVLHFYVMNDASQVVKVIKSLGM